MSEREQEAELRELDALVHRALRFRDNLENLGNSDWQYCPNLHEKGDDCEWFPVPHYSTDMAAAWLVVEYLRQGDDEESYTRFRRFVDALDRVIQERKGRSNGCGLTPFGMLKALGPEDICRAALAALHDHAG